MPEYTFTTEDTDEAIELAIAQAICQEIELGELDADGNPHPPDRIIVVRSKLCKAIKSLLETHAG